MDQATRPNQALVEGRLAETDDRRIVLALPETDYRLHLVVDHPPEPDALGRVRGTIHARARRVDRIGAGGRYVEPVYGRPRRVQGRVVAVDASANTLTVHAGCGFVCELTADQQATGFEPGQMVSFDVEPGTRFVPAAATD